jgi:hypothetical protein
VCQYQNWLHYKQVLSRSAQVHAASCHTVACYIPPVIDRPARRILCCCPPRAGAARAPRGGGASGRLLGAGGGQRCKTAGLHRVRCGLPHPRRRQAAGPLEGGGRLHEGAPRLQARAPLERAPAQIDAHAQHYCCWKLWRDVPVSLPSFRQALWRSVHSRAVFHSSIRCLVGRCKRWPTF